MFDLLLYAAVFAGVCAAAFLVARSPAFWWGLVLTIAKSAWPFLLKAFAPRDMTKEEKDRIARGEEPGLAGQNARNNDGMHHK